MRTTFVGSVLACAVLLMPALGSAQDPSADTGAGPSRVFGDVGQLAISSDAAFSIEHRSSDATTISFGPAADYFVMKNLSIGGLLLFNYQSAGAVDSTRFQIGPRVGYNLPFTDMLSLWPKLGFSFTHDNISTESEGVEDDTEVTISRSGSHFTLNLFAPLMFHPVPHFFVGFGPFLDADLSGDNKVTTFGGRLTIGGWIDT
jgi:hypothetical protein